MSRVWPSRYGYTREVDVWAHSLAARQCPDREWSGTAQLRPESIGSIPETPPHDRLDRSSFFPLGVWVGHLDDALFAAVEAGRIDARDAYRKAHDKARFEALAGNGA